MARTTAEAPKQPAATPPRTLEEHLAWLQVMSAAGMDLRPVAEGLFREKFALTEALVQVKAHQEKLREEIAALCEPEQYPAVVTGVHVNGEATVEVHGANMRMQVAVHPQVPRERLRVGARGLLSKSRNCLLQIEDDRPTWHDVGTFEDYVGDRRVLLRHQEQLVGADLADDLVPVRLRKGDLVGFDRDGAHLAYQKLEPPGKEHLFFEATPADRFEELGGLDREIALLKRIVRFRVQHPDLAARYRLPAKRGILLEGPPGNGKTKLARCLANFVAGLSEAGECRFMAIAGSSDYSMWLGQSEQKIIARFDAARELAERGGTPCVMFFDEIDAIGRRRNTDLGSGAPDRILSTFLAQLDGVQQVSNLIVIGATNRADILDSGLVRPGRLGDVKVRLPAPNRLGARAILSRYLGGGLPVAGDVDGLIEGLLSRVYSPRGDYAEMARVTLRDGRKVPVGGRDVVSGAMLENVVRVAAEEAADREAQTGSAGVTETDLTAALDQELRGAAALLTPFNVRSYVTRLPQDVDPVAVEPVGRGPGAALYTRSA
ncbi:MAG TPA: AAA family ATPase [Gemmataceae bacterium]|nr:AAA family ATPase [Gemmataceae bacterium]